MKRMTLEQILETEKAHRKEDGKFGIKACKKSILFDVKLSKSSLYNMLEKYVELANEDIFFNKVMVLACWELINEQ